MRIPLLAVVTALLTSLQAGPHTAYPVYVRPTAAAEGAEIGAEQAARDNDPVGSNTWATKVFNRSCTQVGGCAGVSSAATVWHGFPAGYRPRKLVVFWKAASSIMMFGGSSQVRAFIEYTTGGQVWTPLDRFVQNGTELTPMMKPAEVALGRTIDPAAVKVRARLDVDLIACPADTCAANLPNPSNLSGQIWISDIRLEVEDPTLTASHARASKGQSVMFRVEGAPGARISNWMFTPAKGPVVRRLERHTEATWALDVSESGSVSVNVELSGQPQLTGRTFKLTRAIEVRAPRRQ
jgi:hypothetical protein